MPIYTSSSESDNEPSRPSRTTPRPRPPRLLGSQKPIHDILGGGKVADVLLWKNITVSASLLIGMTVIWFLFEVVEYNFVTLLCHISITSMLALFIWSKGAEFFNWKPPQIPEVILRESTFREVASTLRVIAILYIFSVIGTYFSFLNLLYLGFICILTVPFLYDRYDEHVDYIADREFRRMKKMFRRFNSQFLNKIPRGPVKEN
ncbi:reticulon-like protein B9 [Citrus sinensis]|uniref:Reticulon-like protein B9 n=1 Tax=Citrus sinensis TaxID=2711 RepID=A0ACB8M018_CITSI|nr:reticulon-like protein B9 [Citrus sinensis]